MIELHTLNTPSARTITVMLEEIESAYTIRLDEAVDGRELPAIIDHNAADGARTVAGSGAILRYLAERSSRLLPSSGPDRVATLQWIDWCGAAFGPALSKFRQALAQPGHFDENAIRRFTAEAAQRFDELDNRLSTAAYLAGDSLSIADIAVYPLTCDARDALSRAADGMWSHVARWEQQLLIRPAIGRGMAALG